MEFRLLGAFEVWNGGQPVEIVGSKRRALLALLVLRANEVVRSELLIDELWGERPPRNAAAALQTHVSRLRKALGADTIASREWGYVLRAAPAEIDLRRFEGLVAEAEPLAAQQRAAKLAEALELWRGPPLADLANEPALYHDIARLEELRVSTLERRIDADLELGRNTELVGELETLVAQQPLREHLRWLLILALYRAGRQAEALEVYRETRRVLADELGLEPSPELRELERAILQQDPALRTTPVSPAMVAVTDVRPAGRRRIYIAASVAALILAGLGTAAGYGLNAHPTHAAQRPPTSVLPNERNLHVLAWKSLERAPRSVLHYFATLELGAPSGTNPQPVSREARKVPLPDGGTVYVTPATNGGFCERFAGTGGCDPARSFAINATVGSRGGCGVPSMPTLLAGHVNAEPHSTLDLQLSDGSFTYIGLTWVGPPISAGFFEESPPAGKHMTALLVRLPSGKILAKENDIFKGLYRATPCYGSLFSGITRPPGGAQLRHKRRLLAQPTAAGPAAIWTAPDRVRPGSCTWLTIGRAVYGGECRRSRPPRRGLSEVVPLGLRVKGQMLRLLWGHVGANVANLELRFQDGTVTRLPLTESVFLYAFPDNQWRAGHRPGWLIAHEKNGNRLSERLPWD